MSSSSIQRDSTKRKATHTVPQVEPVESFGDIAEAVRGRILIALSVCRRKQTCSWKPEMQI